MQSETNQDEPRLLLRPRIQLLLIVLGLGITLMLGLSATDGLLTAPLDDSYIYLRYGERLASGHGLSYVPGEAPSPGVTSVLYAMVMGAVALVTPGLETALFGAQLLGLLALVLCVRRATRLAGSEVDDGAAPWVAGLLLSMGPLYWVVSTGMDTMPFAAMLVWAFERSERRLAGRPAHGLLLALALLAAFRPEGAAVAGVLALALAWRVPGEAPRVLGSVLVGAGVSAALLFGMTGHALPSSGAAKSILLGPHGSRAEQLRYACDTAATLLLDLRWTGSTLPAFFPLVLIGLLSAGRGGRRWVAPALLVGLAVPLTMKVPFPNRYRYLLPFLPLLTVYWVLGARRLLRAPGVQGLATGLVALTLLFHAARSADWITRAGRDAAEIHFQHGDMAAWVDENLPKEVVLGVNDAGYLTLDSGRRTVDMAGLTSPGMARPWGRGPGGTLEALQRRKLKPDAFCGYVEWFPGLIDEGIVGDVLRISEVPYTPAVAGGKRMIFAPFDPAALKPDPGPCWELGEWRVVAEVDLADVDSEDASDYRLNVPAGIRWSPALMRKRLGHGCGRTPFVEGGYRVEASGDEFEVSGVEPGTPLHLLVRYRSTAPLYLIPLVDGEPAPAVEVPLDPDFGLLTVSLGEAPSSRFRLGTLPTRALEVFHYWVLAPNTMEP